MSLLPVLPLRLCLLQKLLCSSGCWSGLHHWEPSRAINCSFAALLQTDPGWAAVWGYFRLLLWHRAALDVAQINNLQHPALCWNSVSACGTLWVWLHIQHCISMGERCWQVSHVRYHTDSWSQELSLGWTVPGKPCLTCPSSASLQEEQCPWCSLWESSLISAASQGQCCSLSFQSLSLSRLIFLWLGV